MLPKRSLPTVHKRTVRRVLAAVAAGGVLAGTGLAAAGQADAAPGVGCETIAAPGLLNWLQKRTICDTPKRADGSWTRARQYWTPAHYKPVSCYRWSCSGGYHVGETVRPSASSRPSPSVSPARS